MGSVGDVLADLKAIFQRHEIGWYVFGAQAVVVFGRPRQTIDIDVTVRLALDEISKLASALDQAGFCGSKGKISKLLCSALDSRPAKCSQKKSSPRTAPDGTAAERIKSTAYGI